MSLSILFGDDPSLEQIVQAANVYVDMMMEHPNKCVQVLYYKVGKRCTSLLMHAILSTLRGKHFQYWKSCVHNEESLIFDLKEGTKAQICICSAMGSIPPSPGCVLQININDI
jgi:hypothetical protein